MHTCWQALRSSLLRFVSTPMAHWHFNDMKRTQHELRRFGDAVELLGYFHCTEDDDLEAKDRVLGQLVTLVQTGGRGRPLGTSLLWLTLWPGLDAVYRRAARYFAGTPEELLSEMGARFTAAVHRADLARIHRLAATLVYNVERDILVGQQRVWAEGERSRRLAEGYCARQGLLAFWMQEAATRSISEFGLPPGLSVEEESDALRQVLTKLVGSDADIVVDVVIRGESQREVGERLGLTHAAARKRYQRALARVGRAFRAGELPAAGARPLYSSRHCQKAREH
jgi:DNA-directed RNA polymerase specialized sigma24 family protein